MSSTFLFKKFQQTFEPLLVVDHSSAICVAGFYCFMWRENHRFFVCLMALHTVFMASFVGVAPRANIFLYLLFLGCAFFDEQTTRLLKVYGVFCLQVFVYKTVLIGLFL